MGALLLRAAKQGSLVLVRALLSHPSCDLMARDEEGNTALHIAASSGHHDVVEELVGVATRIVGLLVWRSSPRDLLGSSS